MNRTLDFTPEALREIRAGATIAISLSGGKDSQALLIRIHRTAIQQGWPGEIFAIHAHLGRAEWPQTLAHCQKLCAALEMPLVVVERARGDLIDRIEQRLEKLQSDGSDAPFWPSSASRYCTSELKRGPIDKYLRRFQRVISVEGIRGSESTNRAKKQIWSTRETINCGIRNAYTWNAIHTWTSEDVWYELGEDPQDLERRRKLYQDGKTVEALDGWGAHPAYVFGNERLSCVFCILGSKNDLEVGARHNPELLQIYTDLEVRGKSDFKNGFSLKQLRPT